MWSCRPRLQAAAVEAVEAVEAREAAEAAEASGAIFPGNSFSRMFNISFSFGVEFR